VTGPSTQVLILAAGIGIVAGLRSLTAPAAVSWAAHLGWLDLHGSPLAFMGSTAAVVIFSILALGEYLADKLPRTPSRTRPGSLIGRVIMGGLAGACLSVSAGQYLLAGALVGGLGAVIGTYGGYEIRRRLVSGLKVKDRFVAIPEDLVAIGLAYLIVSSMSTGSLHSHSLFSLTLLGPSPNVGLLALRKAHPAKAGAAKPRVLRPPRAYTKTLRGTTKIAELLWLARRSHWY
jgi:uncharacterized membrane protein